jgi:hypothetical protein
VTPAEVERFTADGFVRLTGAVPEDLAEECRRELWAASGCDPDDRTTWRQPLVRLGGLSTSPFRAAANTPALLEAFDQLVGVGGWLSRTGLGTFPLRFPSTEPAPEAGWHVEASFTGPDGGPRLNLHSRGRALLMLFLFSEVGPRDAPTRVRIGSHLDVAPLLEPAGDDGMDWMTLCQLAVPASEHREVALATGASGDVYLCHPFLVHAASEHRGTTPRFMAQPPLEPTGLLDLEAADPTPVARAVLRGLADG